MLEKFWKLEKNIVYKILIVQFRILKKTIFFKLLKFREKWQIILANQNFRIKCRQAFLLVWVQSQLLPNPQKAMFKPNFFSRSDSLHPGKWHNSLARVAFPRVHSELAPTIPNYNNQNHTPFRSTNTQNECVRVSQTTLVTMLTHVFARGAATWGGGAKIHTITPNLLPRTAICILSHLN